jgi:hypothetical protein
MEKAKKDEKKEKELFPFIADTKKQIFLETYARTGNVTDSAKTAGIDSRTHYNWLKADEQYREAFELAKEAAADFLEKEAWRRATQGLERDIFFKDKKIGVRKDYSDTLLIFLLKGIRPEKYKDFGRFELTGKNGEAVQFEHRLKDLLEE